MQYALIDSNGKRTRTITTPAAIPWDDARLISALRDGETGPDGSRLLPIVESGEARYGVASEAEKSGQWAITYRTAEAWQAEQRAAATPPDTVLLAAMELHNAVAEIARDYGVVFDLSSGYNETYAAIFGPESAIPEANRAGVWALVDTRYRNLDYHIQKWQAGTVTWDALPAIAAALANMQQ